MKKKTKIILIVTAVVVVLAVAIGIAFAVAHNDNSDNEYYYVDENGNKQVVEVDDKGNYYITDENGEITYIDDKETIDKIEENILPDDVQQVIDSVKDNPESVFDKADKEDGLQMSDDLVSDEIVTLPADQGAKDAAKRLSSYSKIVSSKKFTIDATVKEVSSQTTEYPFTYIRNGDGAFVETSIPFDEEGTIIKAEMIIVDGKTYCVIPSIRSYMVVEDMTIDDLASGNFSSKELESYTFVESGTVTVNGKKYICDVYTVDKETVKYYYDTNNNLIRIERIAKNQAVITEINEIKTTADSSKIKKPRGYIDLTKLMEE